MEPWFENDRVKLYHADVVAALQAMPAESVHCCLTSPPYWSLRDYGVEGQIGLEPNFGEFIERMVGVFEEVRRVLRKDGTCWVNMGESWSCSPNGRSAADTKALGNDDRTFRDKPDVRESFRRDRAAVTPAKGPGLEGAAQPGGVKVGGRTKAGFNERYKGKQYATDKQAEHDAAMPARPPAGGKIKNKDMIGQGWALAFALRDAGWWLRDCVIWAKGNPMPSSVTDRTTMSHEYLFLLAKSPRYYFDWFAIRERAVCTDPRKGKVTGRGQGGFAHAKGDDRDQSGGFPRDGEWRNRRSVWEVNTQPSMFKHYATFPRDLVRPVVMAGTSEAGCCAKCAKPYERIVRKSGGNTGKDWLGENADKRPERGTSGCMRADTGDGSYRVESVGWKRTCKCTAVHAEPVPCVMLDPFAGTSTTGEVALQLGRRYVGIELNLRSCEDSKKRLLATAVPIPDLAAA